jgi:metal-responsive CopG/Arc/MetJ family transcriptional regulator
MKKKRELVRDMPQVLVQMPQTLIDEADAVAAAWFGKSRMAYIRHLIRQDVNRRRRYGDHYEPVDSMIDRLSPATVETALRAAK